MTSQQTLTAVVAKVHHFAGRLTSDRLVDRDDVTQQAIVELLTRKAVPAVGHGGINAYAFCTCALSLANARRKAGRYANALQRYEKMRANSAPRQSASPLAALVADERREQIAAALVALSEEERRAVQRHFFAAELPEQDPSLRAERKRVLNRALGKLRALLADLRPTSAERDQETSVAVRDPRRPRDRRNVSRSSRCALATA